MGHWSHLLTGGKKGWEAGLLRNLANVNGDHSDIDSDTERLCLTVPQSFATIRARGKAPIVVNIECGVP